MIEIKAVADLFIVVAITVPGGFYCRSALEVEGFAQYPARRHIVYVQKGFGCCVGGTFKGCYFVPLGIKGIGVVDEGDGDEKNTQPA